MVAAAQKIMGVILHRRERRKVGDRRWTREIGIELDAIGVAGVEILGDEVIDFKAEAIRDHRGIVHTRIEACTAITAAFKGLLEDPLTAIETRGFAHLREAMPHGMRHRTADFKDTVDGHAAIVFDLDGVAHTAPVTGWWRGSGVRHLRRCTRVQHRLALLLHRQLAKRVARRCRIDINVEVGQIVDDVVERLPARQFRQFVHFATVDQRLCRRDTDAGQECLQHSRVVLCHRPSVRACSVAALT